MSDFPIFDTAASGLRTDRVWMDAVSDNIANIDTVRPFDQPAFQERMIVASAVRGDQNDPPGVGGGSVVAGVEYGSAQGVQRYDPGNPLANKDGMVRYPDIDLGDQMTQLLMSERSYQLNLAVVDRARDAYLQALNITGK
jgi:flagellar basal-body rod protein FlgC